jgi:VanZ family protein
MKKTNFPNSYKLLSQWTNILVVISAILVILLTLFPYDFFFAEVLNQLSYSYMRSRIVRPDDLGDVIANIFLFMPFGFGVGCLTSKMKLTHKKAALAALIFSFALTFSVEFLQIFLPTRNPSHVDLITNTLGGIIGFYGFQLGGIYFLYCLQAIVNLITHSRFRPMLIAIAIAYLFFIFSFTVKLQNKIDLWKLSFWDVNFPLTIGNEFTGDRPWRGQISHLCIGDRAASTIEVSQLLNNDDSCQALASSLVAAYDFKQASTYSDSTNTLPNLEWDKGNLNERSINGVEFNSDNWLKTRDVSVLNEKIKNSSQFTISFIITSKDSKQNGPARIISISPDVYNRNITIGQWQDSLSIRLRNLLAGANGTRPELIVPNVFNNTEPHHLIVTYNGNVLSVYIDKIENKKTIEFNAENALFWSVVPHFPFYIHINILNSVLYQSFYYAIAAIPVCFCLVIFLSSWTKLNSSVKKGNRQ